MTNDGPEAKHEEGGAPFDEERPDDLDLDDEDEEQVRGGAAVRFNTPMNTLT